MKGFTQTNNPQKQPVGPEEAKKPGVIPEGGSRAFSPHVKAGEGSIFGDDSGYEEVMPMGERVEPSDEAVDMTEREDDEARLRRIEVQAEAQERRQAVSEPQFTDKRYGKKQPPKAIPMTETDRRHVDASSVPMSKLNGVPRCLVERARMQFPTAERQQDAVAAYIYFHEGMPADMAVPDEIVSLAMSFEGDNITVETVKDLVERDMLDIKAQNRQLLKKLDTLELALAYMIFEKAGFSKEEAMSPDSIKFLEKGINDLISKLEADAETQRMRKARQQGRPIR